MAEKKGAFNMLLGVMDKVSAPMKKINDSISKVTGPVNRLKYSFKSLSRQAGIQKLKSSVSNLKNKIGGLASSVGGLVAKFGALGGAAAFGVAKLVEKTAEYGDVLAKTSDRIGISTKELQQWRFVGERSGVAAADMDKSFEGFSKRLGEARAGSGSLFTILKKGNPQLLEQLKAAKGNGDAFDIMMKAMASTNNAQIKAALGTAAFGRAGMKLINVANNGAEGIEKLKKRSEELGLVSEKQARGSEEYIDTLFDFKMAFQGIWQQVSFAVMPILQKLFSRLTAWFVEMRPTIVQFTKQFVEKIPSAFKATMDYLKALWKAIQPVISFVARLTEILGGFGNVLKILAVVVLAKVIMAIFAVGSALVGLGITIMTTPIGWIIAGIAALVGVFYLVGKHIGGVVEWFRNLNPVIKLILAPIYLAVEAVNLLVMGFKKLMSFAGKKLIPDSVKTLFGFSSNNKETEQKSQAKSALKSSLQKTETTVNGSISVDFSNVPQGTNITTKGEQGLNLNANAGYAMGI